MNDSFPKVNQPAENRNREFTPNKHQYNAAKSGLNHLSDKGFADSSDSQWSGFVADEPLSATGDRAGVSGIVKDCKSLIVLASAQEESKPQPQQQLPQSAVNRLERWRKRKKNKPSKAICDAKLTSAWLVVRVVLAWSFNGCFWIFAGLDE